MQGFSGAVALSASGLPSGASASFSPSTLTGSGSSTLTLQTGSAAAGTYHVNVTGTSGSLSHSVQISWALSSTPPVPVISAVSPSNLAPSTDDVAQAIATDSVGGLVLAGYSTGDYAATNLGNQDAFVTRYDRSFNLVWKKQFGTSGADIAYAVAADTHNNIYVSGTTNGSMGGTNYGGFDVFTLKYSNLGTLLWTQQTGTGQDEEEDPNATVQVTLSTPIANTFVGAITRADPTSPDAAHYAGYIGPEGAVHIARRNNWNYTILVDGRAFPSGTHTLSIAATGTNPVVLSLKVDGTQVLSYSDSSSSALSSGMAGMFDYSGASQPFSQFKVSQSSLVVGGGTFGSMASTNQGGKDVFLLEYTP